MARQHSSAASQPGGAVGGRWCITSSPDDDQRWGGLAGGAGRGGGAPTRAGERRAARAQRGAGGGSAGGGAGAGVAERAARPARRRARGRAGTCTAAVAQPASQPARRRSRVRPRRSATARIERACVCARARSRCMQEAETAAMRAREQRLRDELQRVTASSEQELSTRLGELAALQREKAAAAVRAGEMEGALREWQVSGRASARARAVVGRLRAQLWLKATDVLPGLVKKSGGWKRRTRHRSRLFGTADQPLTRRPLWGVRGARGGVGRSAYRYHIGTKKTKTKTNKNTGGGGGAGARRGRAGGGARGAGRQGGQPDDDGPGVAWQLRYQYR
eukprot:COSAG01_NODE_9386_length_2460_cov_5.186785_3_plen_334_part_00